MAEPLRLDGGIWSRDGRPWRPEAPFYGVIGDPVTHSLSPRMQGAALAERGLPHEYLALAVTADQLPALKERADELAGFNVTAPHKEAVAALCDGRTEQARRLGVVNTVRVEDGRWLGHNTDSGGLLAVLSQAWTEGPPPELAVVLGAGGSARAAVDALLRWGVTSVQVRWHTDAGRGRFADWLGTCGLGDEVTLAPLVPDVELPPHEPSAWICCLAGGVPAAGSCRRQAARRRPCWSMCATATSGPPRSRPLGFSACDGLPLLLMQGGLSFAWWFGPPVPWPAMRAALAVR